MGWKDAFKKIGGFAISPIAGTAQLLTGGKVGDFVDDLTGSGEQTATTTTQVLPAPRDSDQEKIWDSYMDQIFGNTINAGPFGSFRLPSMLERLKEDTLYSKGEDEKYIGEVQKLVDNYLGNLSNQADTLKTANRSYGDEMKDATGNYIANTTADTNQYKSDVGSVMSGLKPTATASPINLKFGNFSTPFYSGTQRYAQNEYTGLANDILNASNTLSGTTYDKQSALSSLLNDLTKQNVSYEDRTNTDTLNMLKDIATMTNTINKTYTPNSANLAFQDYIGNLASNIESLRYGLPQTTTTGAYEPSTNYLGQLNTILDTVKNLGSFLKPTSPTSYMGATA